ncbi:MAG: hypothetical protein PHC66_01300 [Candidatus Nanoarchaeia archaeon]|nr:hypothetical protein [Candidatus Nanoarchaeia archaeon]MDD5239130.1 hypothetical protein [Candidatus Nanoarchaeia archaeon]
MLQNISYFMIFGKPLIMYLGILVLLLFLTTASLGYMIFKGIKLNGVPVKLNWHKAFAISAITLGLLHAILGILLFF